ncbi:MULTISPECIES: hypothetical protein [Thermomonospora]|uniref:Uncharacterized protein n=1 Tax=Thermomonospora cellulosilytica TaxID=1411118 RepID=A0A7W3R8F2_9ACTN|nr:MULTISPECIES: hypothetical protein [Thermomonospora]MBA9003646.1 hypothetical protein [Thermomonospora cellulosilytica]
MTDDNGDLWTIDQAAEYIGASSTGSARRTLSRWGVKAAGYEPGESGRPAARYRAADVRAAKAARPGRGARMDLAVASLEEAFAKMTPAMRKTVEALEKHGDPTEESPMASPTAPDTCPPWCRDRGKSTPHTHYSEPTESGPLTIYIARRADETEPRFCVRPTEASSKAYTPPLRLDIADQAGAFAEVLEALGHESVVKDFVKHVSLAFAAGA